jgi:hypothetical protein
LARPRLDEEFFSSPVFFRRGNVMSLQSMCTNLPTTTLAAWSRGMRQELARRGASMSVDDRRRSVGMMQPDNFPKLLTGGGLMLQDLGVDELEAELAERLQLGFTEEARIVKRELDGRRAAKTAKQERDKKNGRGQVGLLAGRPGATPLPEGHRDAMIFSMSTAGSGGSEADRARAAIAGMTRGFPGQRQREQQEQLAAAMSVGAGADDEDRVAAAIRALARRLPRA